MTTSVLLIFFFLTTLISQNYANNIAEKKYDKQTPQSSKSLSSKLQSSESLSSKLTFNEAKKFLYYGNLQKPKYDHHRPPPSSKSLPSKFTYNEAKKFLYYGNLQKPKYDHHRPPPSSENLSSNTTYDEAKNFLYYGNLQKPKYDHHRPPPSSESLSSNLNYDETMKFVDKANSEKDKYELPSDLSKLPINFFTYNSVRNGTRMVTMFINQGESSLLPKTDPKWTNKSWSSMPECGKSTVTGEIRGCVDSKESMLKFVTPIMGNNVKTLTTPPGKLQIYSVVAPVRTTHNRVTTCHMKGDLNYLPFAVYTCHYIPNSRVRVVPLLGADGTRLEALVVCHMDTSSWDPLGFVLQLLNTKPGAPVCHFMATDDLLWVQS